MRKPGRLRFKSYTLKGDLAVLRRYLDSCATTHCHVPTAQRRCIEQQIQVILEKNCGAGTNVLKTDELWTNFFRVLLQAPMHETVRMKRRIAELFAKEYDIRGEACLGKLVYKYAMKMGRLTTDACEVEMQRLAGLDLGEMKIRLASEAERKYDAQLLPMFRRVEAYKKAQVRWLWLPSFPRKD